MERWGRGGVGGGWCTWRGGNDGTEDIWDGGGVVEFNHLCAISGRQHRENRRIAILVVVVKKEAVVRW